MTTAELKQLITATGLSMLQLCEMLDTDYRSLLRWLSGERKPRHPAMLKKALQLVVLEQRGVITEKVIIYTEKESKK